MTTLICDFRSIVGEKIEGYATLTAGKVRPSYNSPAVLVHEPIKQVVTDGQTTFENVNPGDAVITVEWADQTQSATIRFVVPDSEEAIYLADCLSADSLDPTEIELLRWGIRENLSGAREMLESAKNLGLTEINGTVDAYFTEAAEILRKALEAAHLAEQSLGTIDDKVSATEGVVTDVDEAKQQIQGLLDELEALGLELDGANTDLAGAVSKLNALTPQVSAATQAASEATQKAQTAVNELNTVQNANAAEFNSIKKDLDTATKTAKQATDAVAQTNQQLGIEVQRILGEVDTALSTANEATAQARLANENLETYQYQLGEISQEQGRILSQQAEIVGSYEFQLAEIERLSSEISTATSELESISGDQAALVTEMNTQVGSLQELTAAQGAAINAAKSQADKGVTDAAAASNALSAYKKVNDPKVTKAQSDATKGINDAAAAKSAANQAALDATNKALAAQEAAEDYAREAAEAAQAQAEETAAAEALRVAKLEAAAAKTAAATDAKAKADEAERLAKVYAEAQAKTAKEQAEKTAAKDAATKAENARIAAEANAKVLSDKAQQAAAAAQSSIDNLEIGGRNLARRRNLAGNSSYQTVVDTGEKFWTGEPIYYGEKITSGTPPTSLSSNIRIEPGETYTVSMWIKGETDSGAINANILFYNVKANKSLGGTATGSPASEWHLISGTVTNDTDAAYESVALYFYINRNPGEKTWFTSPKLERGNKATDWTPAPEDVDESVAKAQAEAELARSEATSKSNAARVAAEKYAKEQAEAAQADAEVEAARVALEIAQREAKAAKDAAAEDATSKANAARTAAESLAKAEAKAAKESAEATAALDASTKANKAKTDAEAKAATLATAAQNAAATALSTYKGQNDPKVTKAQKDATSGITKADAAKKQADKGVADAATALARANEANNKLPAITADVSAAAKTALEAVNALPGIRTDISTAKKQADKGVQDAATAKSAVDNLEIGGRNLAEKSVNVVDRLGSPSGSRREYSNFDMGTPYASVPEGSDVTISFDLEMVFNHATTRTLQVYCSNRRGPMGFLARTLTFDGIPKGETFKGRVHVVTKSSKWGDQNSDTCYVEFYSIYETDNWYKVTNLKVERGTKATDWTPAPEDVDAGITTAQTTAETARTEAETKANKALQDATTALTNYQKVNDPKVTAAKSTADTAKTRADKGVADAATAKSAADTAKQRADKGVSDAATAKSAADTAKARADKGVQDAATAKSAADSARAQADKANDLLRVQDTRNTDELPHYYWTNYSQTTVNEFKSSTTLGLSGGYGTLTTVVPWTDASGGSIQQTFVVNNGGATYRRRSTGSREAATWTAWVNELAELNSQISTLNTKAGELTTGLANAATQKDYNDLNTRLWGGQGEINKLQGNINANNSAFQTWQTEINNRRDIWEEAHTKATQALARFAITQSQWNDISSKATNANTKAIASHAALFEGQNKWNEVAAAAIKTQADFAKKQEDWNAVQKKVNDNFQNWQNAATEMLTSTGKFQKLQNQFNSDQKKWNATQNLVNDSQKGINALNTKTNDAQTLAIQGLSAAVSLSFPHLNVAPNNSAGRPWWSIGMSTNSTFTPPGFPEGESYWTSSSSISNVGPDAMITVVPGIDFKLEFWTARVDTGTAGAYVDLRNSSGSSVLSHWADVTNGIPESITWSARNYAGGTLPTSTSWVKKVYLLRVRSGNDKVALHFRPGSTATTNGTRVRYWGAHLTAFLPVQEQIDSAQNKAIEALNRFAVTQSQWNTVSNTATSANTAALAAKKVLDDNQSRWIQAADLAIANLQTTSTKYKQWTDGATLAIANLKSDSAKFKQWTDGATLALNNLKTTSAKFKEWTDGATTAIALNRELIGEQGLIQENQRLQMEALQEAVAEQTKLLYDELQSKPEIITVGDGQSYYDSRITVNLAKSGSRVSKVTVHANGTWAGIIHVEADHGKSDGPGSTFMNYTPLLQKVNLVNTTSRDIVLTRNTSVDHIGKVRITYWVYPGVVLTTQKTGSSLTVEKEKWLTLHTFTATDTATFNAELQVGWDAAGRGPEYGVRLTVNGTSVASDGPRNGVGPDFPWQDGYRQMSIKKTVVVQKGQTVRWEAYVSSGSTNERRIRNFNARATYMYRGLTEK